ncbi:hypothetical protein MRX96_046213 [Rhipicephalus microplus]
MNSEPENTVKELRGVLAPEIAPSSLEKLKLSGFLLDYGCVCLLSSLVAKQGGSLKHLDISGCRWMLKGSQKSLDAPTNDVQPFEQYCVGLEPLDKREEVRLSHLSVNVKGLKLHDFKTPLFVATPLESLRTISICDVALDVLPEICRAVRKLELRGCNEPDLSTCLGEVTVNHSLLLQVIFSNSSLRTLRLSQIRLGEVNLNFMVDAVYCNDTLTELDFSSWDLSERTTVCFAYLPSISTSTKRYCAFAFPTLPAIIRKMKDGP